MWHKRPDFLVLSAEARWCAVWTVKAFPVDQFPRIQARLAEMYGVDLAPNTLSGVTSLAGTRIPIDQAHSEEIYLVEWPRRIG
jgi:hypothetical protein